MIFNIDVGTINRIWAAFSQAAGELKSVSTSAVIDIYAGTGTVATNGTMTPLTGGTGLYYYPWDCASKLGKYSSVFTFTDAGTIYKDTLDTMVLNNKTSCDVQLGILTKGSFNIWNTFANNTGGEIDAGTMTITIYPNNSDTPHIAETAMTRHGTGLYYYPAYIGTVGNYTAVFQGKNGTSIYGGVWPFCVASGTSTGLPPANVGTIHWDNGTSGTHGILSWTPVVGATGYNIYQASRPFSTFTKIASTVDGTHTIGSLSADNEYWFYVVGTSANGAANPSPIVNGLCYLDSFNYTKNILETVQTQLQTNVPALLNVYVGEAEIITGQLPCAMIIPNDDDNATPPFISGQYDTIYNLNIKVFTNGADAGSYGVYDNTGITGKVKYALEAVKAYSPYWYYSQVQSSEFEKLDTARQLKYTEVSFMAARRINRT